MSHSGRILIVEDNADLALGLKNNLEIEGYQVSVQEDGLAGLNAAREERPDLDQIYMTSVQLMTGRGGWPMSVFLTPDLKPFYGGTYWPPRARMRMPGFFDILTSVQDAWAKRRDEVFAQSDHLTEAIAQHAGIRGEPTTLDEDILKGAMDDLLGLSLIHI